MFCDDRDEHLPYQPGSTKVISKRHIKVVPLSSILPRPKKFWRGNISRRLIRSPSVVSKPGTRVSPDFPSKPVGESSLRIAPNSAA